MSMVLAQQPEATVPPVEAAEPRALEPGEPNPGAAIKPSEHTQPPPPPEIKRNTYRPFQPGWFVRTAYASQGTPLPVEVWDVVVPPGLTKPARFPGGVMFEVIDGILEVVEPALGGVRTGETFSVDYDQSVVVRNDGDRPATLRAVVIGER